MRRQRLSLLLASLTLLGCASTGQTLWTGPKFYVGPGQWAEAITTDPRGRIIEVHRTAPQRPGLRKHLPGKIAIPGFQDAHLHLAGIGRRLELVDLRGSESTADVRKRLRAQLTRDARTTVIAGRGWDQTRFDARQFPTWRDLEGLTTRPIILTRVDGHVVWVNRILLNAINITKESPDPPGGRIVRDSEGKPTGIFIDNAIALVKKHLPSPTASDNARWLRQGMLACSRAGLVTVHDMGMSTATLKALIRIAGRKDTPRLRVFVYLDGSDASTWSYLKTLRGPQQVAPRVWVQGIKLFADGALGSRGAALLDDYADKKGHKGFILTPMPDLKAHIRNAHAMGFQVAVHAIGDRANRHALTAFTETRTLPGPIRHRIEHAQVVHKNDFDRFARLGVIASMQPTHATSDMRWAERRVGPQRVQGAYAWQKMLKHRIPLAFGSDAPVESHRPLLGMWAAITRQTPKGHPQQGWRSMDAMNVQQALKAFTQGASFAVQMEHRLGKLQPGFFFDVTLLDRDPFEEHHGWLKSKVLGTLVGGMRSAP